VGRPAEALAWLAGRCDGVLLLETCVNGRLEPVMQSADEDMADPTQSLDGLGCRPSRLWVYLELRRHFERVYMPATQPEHPEFPLDWVAVAEGQAATSLIRAVFVASRRELDNPLLAESLPMRQTRAEAPAPQ
jgi:hypothetical protein